MTGSTFRGIAGHYMGPGGEKALRGDAWRCLPGISDEGVLCRVAPIHVHKRLRYRCKTFHDMEKVALPSVT